MLAPRTGKKTARNWRGWSAILTGSQLLFFKDPVWALTLIEQMQRSTGDELASRLSLPEAMIFKPDEVIPVKDCVAVYEPYSKIVSSPICCHRYRSDRGPSYSNSQIHSSW